MGPSQWRNRRSDRNTSCCHSAFLLSDPAIAAGLLTLIIIEGEEIRMTGKWEWSSVVHEVCWYHVARRCASLYDPYNAIGTAIRQRWCGSTYRYAVVVQITYCLSTLRLWGMGFTGLENRELFSEGEHRRDIYRWRSYPNFKLCNSTSS